MSLSFLESLKVPNDFFSYKKRVNGMREESLYYWTQQEGGIEITNIKGEARPPLEEIVKEDGVLQTYWGTVVSIKNGIAMELTEEEKKEWLQ